MATRDFSANQENPTARAVTWTGLLNTDDGAPHDIRGYPDRSVQFFGTFGVGGTIVLEGSNDGTNWETLTDPQGNAISKTAKALEQILEHTRFVRPRVSAGDGTTSLTCIIWASGLRA